MKRSFDLISSERTSEENLKPINRQTNNGCPELSDPNWVKIGRVDELYIYPIKSGGKLRTNSVICDFNGMVTTIHNRAVWDGMFLAYNQRTNTIANLSLYPKLAHLNMSVRNGYLLQFNYNFPLSDVYTIYLEKECSEAYRKPIDCPSWHGGTPIKLIDWGDNAALWINKYLMATGLRLLQRHCNPYIEKPNIIKDYWIHYCNIHSTISDEKGEIFMDVPRCVIMTSHTYKKLENESGLNEHLRIRPNILIHTYNESVPFSEEDWEWIKINDVIMRIIKPVVKYKYFCSKTKRYYLTNIEDETANLGVFCAPYVAGTIFEHHDAFVYKSNNL